MYPSLTFASCTLRAFIVRLPYLLLFVFCTVYTLFHLLQHTLATAYFLIYAHILFASFFATGLVLEHIIIIKELYQALIIHSIKELAMYRNIERE